MKQKSKFFHLLLIFLLILTYQTNINAANTKNSVNDLLVKEQVERQEQELKAVSMIKKANKNFLNKKYEVAKDQCLGAISILSKLSPLDRLNKDRINNSKELLSMIYTHWANDILIEAKSTAESGKLDKAISLCKQAAEINPKIKSHCDELVNDLNKQRERNKYHKFKTGLTNNTELNKKRYNIDVLYEQGKKLYRSKNYAEAKVKFENLLAIDPYNSDAIQYLQMVNNKIYLRGKSREKATFYKRAAELEWADVPEVVAKTLKGNRVDVSSTRPISKKETKANALQKKLDSIMIKHISFEDVPVKTAMMFLKSESKRLDPAGKGINIFLRLGKKKVLPPDVKDKQVQENLPEDITIFPEDELITIVLDNVSLGTAIQYICNVANLKYTVGNYAVEIYSPDAPLDMETIVYPLEKELFLTKHLTTQKKAIHTLDLKNFFIERGVTFPQGASAIYDSKISRLIVRNTPSELSKMAKIVNRLNVSEPLVSIESKFVELKQSDLDELGFEWRITTNTTKTGDESTTNDQINRFALVDGTPDEDAKFDRAFGFSYAADDFRIDQVIHALNQKGQIEVLSAPKVTTLNGQKAVIKMITEAYYPESWAEPSSTTQSATVRSILTVIPPAPTFGEPTPQGIIFTVTPFIQSDGYTVDLEMQPEIQRFAGWSDYSYNTTYAFDTGTDTAATQEVKSTLKMPIFDTRTIKTHLKVYDGETVVLGGVLDDEVQTIDDKIPILGDIPLVGRFFSSQVEEAIKTNLLIFTKVQLVKPDGMPVRPQQNNGLPRFRH